MVSPTTQIGVRLEHDLLARVDALAEKLSTPWRKATRSDVLRAIILEGLPGMEAKSGESEPIAPKTAPKTAAKPAKTRKGR